MIAHRDLTRRQHLFIGNVRADSFRLGPLRRELERLKTPGIEDPTLGKERLLAAYEAQVEARAATISGKIGKRPAAITGGHMHRAAQLIEAEATVPATAQPSVSIVERQIAAMPFPSSGGAEPSHAPSHPIASSSTRV